MKTNPKRLSEIKRVYEEGAETFLSRTGDDAIAKNWWDVVEVRDKFLSYIPQESTILDIGCGTGRDARYFIKHSHNMVGIDICEPFITGLQNTTPGKYFVGDIVDPDSSVYQEKYDAVWCNAAIVHLERRESQQVIKNSFQALREWGYFFLSTKFSLTDTHVAEKESKSIPWSIKSYLYYTEIDLRWDLEEAWFEILEVSVWQWAYWGDQFIRVYCKK